MFSTLTATELAALNTELRDARNECRRVMKAHWYDQEVTESYRRLLSDLHPVKIKKDKS